MTDSDGIREVVEAMAENALDEETLPPGETEMWHDYEKRRAAILASLVDAVAPTVVEMVTNADAAAEQKWADRQTYFVPVANPGEVCVLGSDGRARWVKELDVPKSGKPLYTENPLVRRGVK